MTTGFENTLTIRRPVEAVFEYLADFENVPRWNYAIVETHKASGGPVGVGSRYVQRRSTPQPATESFEITEFDPPRRLAIEGTIGPFPARVGYELTRRARARISPIRSTSSSPARNGSWGRSPSDG